MDPASDQILVRPRKLNARQRIAASTSQDADECKHCLAKWKSMQLQINCKARSVNGSYNGGPLWKAKIKPKLTNLFDLQGKQVDPQRKSAFAAVLKR